MKETIIQIIGFVFIWASTSVGRKEDSKVKMNSFNFILMATLISVGVLIIKNAKC